MISAKSHRFQVCGARFELRFSQPAVRASALCSLVLPTSQDPWLQGTSWEETSTRHRNKYNMSKQYIGGRRALKEIFTTGHMGKGFLEKGAGEAVLGEDSQEVEMRSGDGAAGTEGGAGMLEAGK